MSAPVAADRIEDIEWLVRSGETNAEAIAKRVGIKAGSIDKILRRAGRLDLLHKVNA